MDSRQQIEKRMLEMKIAPKRSLGQNFLVAEHVISKIIVKVGAYKPARLIEIGPGLGALTESLFKIKVPTTLLELDREFSRFWRERAVQAKAEQHEVELIEGDALDAPWASLIRPGTVLVSNLPYQISARVVVEMSVASLDLKSMVLMFQKEVAQRIAAQPKTKEYGLLTVIAQAAWKTQTVSEAGPGDFYPPPRVASRVLSFERRPVQIEEGFVDFVKRAFAQRRKFMLKSFDGEREALLKKLEELGYNEKVRAEEITVPHFLELYAAIK